MLALASQKLCRGIAMIEILQSAGALHDSVVVILPQRPGPVIEWGPLVAVLAIVASVVTQGFTLRASNRNAEVSLATSRSMARANISSAHLQHLSDGLIADVAAYIADSRQLEIACKELKGGDWPENVARLEAVVLACYERVRLRLYPFGELEQELVDRLDDLKPEDTGGDWSSRVDKALEIARRILESRYRAIVDERLSREHN